MSHLKRRDFLFDDFLTKDWFETQRSKTPYRAVPAVNIKESNEFHEIELYVPGFKREDLKIDLKERMLTISGEVKNMEDSESDKSEAKYIRKEFSFESFSRSFTLPKGVNGEDLSAQLSEGILSVKIRKMEKKEPQTTSITIE